MVVITIAYMNNELIGIKRTEDYSLYSSPFVIAHQNDIVKSATYSYDIFKKIFEMSDSTWTYNIYNIFTLTHGDPYFYTIFQHLVAAIRDRVGDNRPLWLEAWLNYHTVNEVLDWHFHKKEYIIHGYLSIDPKNTVTEFERYTIENSVGNLYVGKTGPGYDHIVKVREPYIGNRITLAFNVKECNTMSYNHLSFIPI